MKIEDILKKQGELYKNLPGNETVEEYREVTEKTKQEKELEDLQSRLDLRLLATIASGGMLGMGGIFTGVYALEGLNLKNPAHFFLFHFWYGLSSTWDFLSL